MLNYSLSMSLLEPQNFCRDFSIRVTTSNIVSKLSKVPNCAWATPFDLVRNVFIIPSVILKSIELNLLSR